MENINANNVIELGQTNNQNNINNNNQENNAENRPNEGMDIIGLATICFNEWNQLNPGNGGRIDVNHIMILLDAIGIKKNEYELKNLIDMLRQTPGSTFNIQDDDRFDLNDFRAIVRSIREEKSYIEEKFLAEAFSRMDEKKEGVLDFNTLKKFAKIALPKISDQEIWDIINYFRPTNDNTPNDERVLSYENFYRLYHEG